MSDILLNFSYIVVEHADVVLWPVFFLYQSIFTRVR